MRTGGAFPYVLVVAITTSCASGGALSGAEKGATQCLVLSQLVELDIPLHDTLRNLWS
jgi:hypothetical protein